MLPFSTSRMGLREDALGAMQASRTKLRKTEAPGAHAAEPGSQGSGPLSCPLPPSQAQPQGQLGTSQNPPTTSEAILPLSLPIGPQEARSCRGHLPAGRSCLRPITCQLALDGTHPLLSVK